MAELKDGIEQAKQFWTTRNVRQKGFLLAGAGATVLMVALFVRLIGTSDY